MQLSTGLIIVGAYADKVRKTLFAQMKNSIASGEVTSQEVARAAAELNRVLYNVLVDNLKSDKGDVIRVRIECDLSEGKISWKYDTLTVEFFKRVPDEEVEKLVKSTISKVEEMLVSAIEYEVEKEITTALGDIIYTVKLGGEKVGALVVTPLNGQAMVRGAVTQPSPVLIKKGRIDLEGKSIDETIRTRISDLVKAGKNVEVKDAEKAMEEIDKLLEEERGK